MKKLLLAVVVIVAGLALFVSTRPDTYAITRTATISAPVDVTFAQVNDFHKWSTWMPWAKLDPQMKTQIEGAPAGVGAIYTWAGNDKAGEGRMTIIESTSNEHVGIKLEFLKPFASVAKTDFKFVPQGQNTEVSWTMSGTNNFMGKAFSMVMDMDKMMGDDFTRGLAALNEQSQAAAKQAQAAAEVAPPPPAPTDAPAATP